MQLTPVNSSPHTELGYYQVCEGDTISVKVRNHLANGEGTAIHWHGLYQRNSQWMDGVPMLTQCPIPAYTYHQYQFRAEPYGQNLDGKFSLKFFF